MDKVLVKARLKDIRVPLEMIIQTRQMFFTRANGVTRRVTCTLCKVGVPLPSP